MTEQRRQSFVERVFRLDPELAFWMDSHILRESVFGALAAWLAILALSLVANLAQTRSYIESLAWGAAALHWSFLAAAVWFLGVLVRFTYLYYSTAIETRRALKLAVVAMIYFLSALTFGFAYRHLYLLDGALFTYAHPPAPTDPLFELTLRRDFLLFSAFQGVAGSFYKIAPNSVVVSVANWIQTVFNILLLALGVASWVERHAHEVHHDRDGA